MSMTQSNAMQACRKGSITCSVQAAVGRLGPCIRVGDELLGGQVGALEVAARQLDAADHQLARHAQRHQLQPGVQHVAAEVGDRLPDRHACAALELRCHVIACAEPIPFSMLTRVPKDDQSLHWCVLHLWRPQWSRLAHMHCASAHAAGAAQSAPQAQAEAPPRPPAHGAWLCTQTPQAPARTQKRKSALCCERS